MGAYQSSKKCKQEEEKLVDLPTPSYMQKPLSLKDDDEPLLDLSNVDVKKMKKKPCSVDPKLDANPRRRAPPINPKTCKEGSVAMGKDGEFYVIKGGKWMKVSKRIEEKKRELIREKLSDRMKQLRAAPRKAAASPKRRPGRPRKASAKEEEKPKRGPGRPRKAPAKAQTPKRKRCPKGSRKDKCSKKCVKRATTPKRK